MLEYYIFKNITYHRRFSSPCSGGSDNCRCLHLILNRLHTCPWLQHSLHEDWNQGRLWHFLDTKYENESTVGNKFINYLLSYDIGSANSIFGWVLSCHQTSMCQNCTDGKLSFFQHILLQENSFLSYKSHLQSQFLEKKKDEIDFSYWRFYSQRLPQKNIFSEFALFVRHRTLLD